MNTDWYVYYRVRIEHAGLLQSRVVAMQSRLQLALGIQCSLKKRHQTRDEHHTWMEVYLAVPDNFEPILAQEVLSAKLEELIDGDRHTEHFLDVTSCA